MAVITTTGTSAGTSTASATPALAAVVGTAAGTSTSSGVAYGNWAVSATATDAMTLSSSVTSNPHYVLSDRVRFAETIVAGLDLNYQALDLMLLRERTSYIAACAVADALTLADAGSVYAYKLAVATELLALADATTLQVAISSTLADALGFADRADFLIYLQAADALSASDTATIGVTMPRTVTDALSFADAATGNLLFIGEAADDLVLAETLSTAFSLQMMTNDGVVFAGRLPLEEGDFQMWAMNAVNRGVTGYTGLPFSSLVTHEERTFGVRDDGLYEFSGDTDDGVAIDAAAMTGYIDFSAEEDKNVYRAYLYMKSDSSAYLKVHWDSGGARTCKWYEIALLDQTVLANRRIPLARGVRAERWAFEVQNTDGGSLDLRGFEVLPAILRPRPA